jgi:hypothetical protein
MLTALSRIVQISSMGHPRGRGPVTDLSKLQLKTGNLGRFVADEFVLLDIQQPWPGREGCPTVQQGGAR